MKKIIMIKPVLPRFFSTVYPNNVGIFTDKGMEYGIQKLNSIIKVYIINLPEHKDRLELMTKQMESLDIPFEIIVGFDGEKIKDEEMFIFRRDISCAVTKGEVGCALSHLKAYRKLIDSNNEVALVIEDDVIIPSNLKNIINEIVNRNDDEKNWLHYYQK